MKILLLDIETYPHKVYSWGLFKQNIAINQIVEAGETACWAAKWYGEGEVLFRAEWNDKDMVGKVWDLLDQADAVVHYNGTSFDMPTLNWEFAKQQGTPPSPYKEIDLLRTVKQNFRPASKKLDFIAQQLDIGSKLEHRGMDLWHGCMEGDKECQTEMEMYNIQDVMLLEELYNILLPWIRNHPNRNLYDDTGGRDVCPTCGDTHIQYRGYHYTGVSKFRRFQCQGCGKWGRSKKSVDVSNLRQCG